MGFIASLFSGPKKEKTVAPPAQDKTAVQEAAADARRRAAYAKGRDSTSVASRLGDVG